MTKCKITPSLVSLAQELRAALIENMFGVTTSDDYRPVAWMGRYPVDVTTMLVGVHVAAAILAAILVRNCRNAGSCIHFGFGCNSTVQRSGPAGQVWRLFTYAFVHPPSALLWFAIEMYLLFVFGREVERFLGRRAYIALYVFLLLTPAALLTIWGLWNGAQLPVRRFGCITLWNICCVCHDLSARRIVAADHGEVGRANSCCHLHSSTTRLSRLERSGRVWTSIGVAFLFVELNGAGPELAWWNDVQSAVCLQAEVSRPSETTSAHRRQPLRIGRRLHVNRSDPRQNLQVWNWKPHRERAAAVGSRARTVAEKFGVICSRRPVGDVAWAVQSRASHSEAATASALCFVSRASIISHSTCSKSWWAS